jgi:hypothetical protein
VAVTKLEVSFGPGVRRWTTRVFRPSASLTSGVDHQRQHSFAAISEGLPNFERFRSHAYEGYETNGLVLFVTTMRVTVILRFASLIEGAQEPATTVHARTCQGRTARQGRRRCS